MGPSFHSMRLEQFRGMGCWYCSKFRFCLSHCYDDEEQRKIKLQSLEKYRKQEVDERNKITESASMPEEVVHQLEEWKHCVSKKTSSDEREGLQELIVATADWLESHIAHLPDRFCLSYCYDNEKQRKTKFMFLN